MNVVVTNVLINKLESISFDIKYYINMNASISNSLGVDKDSKLFAKCLDESELNEILEIRQRIKTLTKKLKEKL